MSTEDTPPVGETPVSRGRGRPPGTKRTEVRTREQPKGRADRIPLGSHRLKLTASTRPGYVRRWINDKGARVQYATQGGWSFVLKDGAEANSTDPGDRASQIVGTKEGGESMRAYLMEIRKEWYDEDQAAKAKRVAEQEAQIMRGKDEKGEPGTDGRYMRVGTKRIGLK